MRPKLNFPAKCKKLSTANQCSLKISSAATLAFQQVQFELILVRLDQKTMFNLNDAAASVLVESQSTQSAWYILKLFRSRETCSGMTDSLVDISII